MTAARAASLRYGARLAAAVLLAFGVSAALRLPEGFWAVMSALIVVRPSTGSTMNAGWDRVRGALVGTVLGLAGVGLRHQMIGSEIAAGIAPLLLVTALAFGAGLSPVLRSAPISALIVVTSGGIAGHSAGQVALLRALEIGIGVGAALLVALADRQSRATDRFRVAVAEQLRAMAATLLHDAASAPDLAAEALAAGRRRAAIRELVILAGSADHEARLLRHWPAAGPRDKERHRKTALIVARTSNDAGLFARVRQRGVAARAWGDDALAGATVRQDAAAVDAAHLAAARLIATAESLETRSPVVPLPVAAPAPGTVLPGGPAAFVLALLDDDLRSLARLEGLHAARVP